MIMSVVIHEISHGFVAEYFGDKTARNAGRLTLNPVSHLDLFGSIILPALLYFSTGFVFGWARPVPYNPDNLRNRRWGTLAVAAAGVLANFFIAALFGLLIRFSYLFQVPDGFYFITSSIVEINLALMVFNLVPIPPLDGSKILFSLLPRSAWPILANLERYSLVFLIIFIVFFVKYLYHVLGFLYHLVTGIALPA